MTDPTFTNCITFNSPPTEEVIRLDKEGFHYKGQFIADAGEAHRLMVEFLKSNSAIPSNHTARKVLEHLTDAWNNAIQSDLENGVRCLNEAVAAEFHQKYPAITKFGELLHNLYMEQLND